MRGTLTDLVINRKTPVIGICVGMQILAEGSDEGSRPGLGWVPGRVRHFKTMADAEVRVPHMGWNDVSPGAGIGLFAGLEQEARFYFLHSYYFQCADTADAAAEARYGMAFTCAVKRGNVNGVQFHPEKSHHFGARLLKNFAEQ